MKFSPRGPISPPSDRHSCQPRINERVQAARVIDRRRCSPPLPFGCRDKLPGLAANQITLDERYRAYERAERPLYFIIAESGDTEREKKRVKVKIQRAQSISGKREKSKGRIIEALDPHCTPQGGPVDFRPRADSAQRRTGMQTILVSVVKSNERSTPPSLRINVRYTNPRGIMRPEKARSRRAGWPIPLRFSNGTPPRRG